VVPDWPAVVAVPVPDPPLDSPVFDSPEGEDSAVVRAVMVEAAVEVMVEPSLVMTVVKLEVETVGAGALLPPSEPDTTL